ncbi:MAG: Zn-ribbon domain-containing OB-fold protein [Proteobacteria bacterium]|nr:Zn-ribbon domain-containing OB-fold protein [Pseudomonadota bacterium]HQR04499.1 Zn-ribbon domain-containing OB-fold protein [Rhodocyclaceae bacterium]
MSKTTVPAIAGWYTMDAGNPHLIGTRCKECGSYFFPKLTTYCRNPACDSDEFEEVQLSNRGHVWSYTNASYKPPEPFIAADPFVPYAIAAVRLDHEKMIVLGQVVEGIGVENLKVGQEMRLVLETLHEDGDQTKVIWKWKPV